MRFSYLYAYRIPGQARILRFGMRFAYKYALVHTQGSDLVCKMHTLGIRFAYKYAFCIPQRSDLVCGLNIEVCVSHTSMHRCIFRTRLCNKGFRRSGFSACRKSQFRQLRCCTALTCKDSGALDGRGRRVFFHGVGGGTPRERSARRWAAFSAPVYTRPRRAREGRLRRYAGSRFSQKSGYTHTSLALKLFKAF